MQSPYKCTITEFWNLPSNQETYTLSLGQRDKKEAGGRATCGKEKGQKGQANVCLHRQGHKEQRLQENKFLVTGNKDATFLASNPQVKGMNGKGGGSS